MAGNDTPPADTPSAKPQAWRPITRGLRHRCPECGEGKLYQRYLKQVQTCSVCGAQIGLIRAEDGPPWMTVLFLGPFLAALTFITARQEWPLWITLPALSLFAISAVLSLLPRIKGAIIGLFWHMGAQETPEEEI